MIMIIIMIMIMNVEFIWLTSLNALKIKVSFVFAYNFNQLIYAVCAPPHRVKKTFPVHHWLKPSVTVISYLER